MTGVATARATAEAVSGLAGKFMLDGATYAHGAGLGFSGLDFYVTGRGGPLGRVDGDVVAAAFAFFNPAAIRELWKSGSGIMDPERAALEFAGCAHRWGEEHLSTATVDLDRVGMLAGRVVDGAGVACAPLFAAWRRLPVDVASISAPARAMHHLNGLRELRAAFHAAAVVAAGITPLQAVLVRTPHMAALFGWSPEDVSGAGPTGEGSAAHTRWGAAEAATDIAMGAVFDRCLTSEEQSEAAELFPAALAACA